MRGCPRRVDGGVVSVLGFLFVLALVSVFASVPVETVITVSEKALFALLLVAIVLLMFATGFVLVTA